MQALAEKLGKKHRVYVLSPDLSPKPTRRVLVGQLVRDYQIVRKELEKYGKGLAEKKEIVVVNKMELIDEKLRPKIEVEFAKKIQKDIIWVSAGMGEVGELVGSLSVVDPSGIEPLTSSMP